MRILAFIALCAGLMLGVERPKFEDFAACYARNKASVMVYEGTDAFVLSDNLLAVLKTPNQKLNRYVKYDPFLNLYLVRTDFSLFPPVTYDEQNLTRNDWVGIIDPQQPYIGHLKYLAQNINERDQLDFRTKVGQLDTTCCSMLGIALGDGSFIGNRYLKHFAKYNDVYWGDIGVDFVMRDNKIYVESVRNNGKFLINDEIVSVDGVSAKDLRKLNETILFSDRGATLYFVVLRDNRDLNISTNVFAKDLSRFNLPVATPAPKKVVKAAYTNTLGLTINKNLIITRVAPDSKAANAGFKVGDKIIRINNEVIKNVAHAQRIFVRDDFFRVLVSRAARRLPVNKQEHWLLRENEQFQFFIRLSK